MGYDREFVELAVTQCQGMSSRFPESTHQDYVLFTLLLILQVAQQQVRDIRRCKRVVSFTLLLKDGSLSIRVRIETRGR